MSIGVLSQTHSFSDRLRQSLNLVLSLGQVLTTYLAFSRGTSFDEATHSSTSTPPIIPADYAFTIWGLIYASSVAYGIYQAIPSQRTNPLLRRIGLSTASAFLGTIAWLVMARFGRTWATVGCIAWMEASLLTAFMAFVRHRAPFTRAERWFVVFPVSVFTGWVTVAVFANTSAALAESGLLNTGLSERGWAVLMLVVAGLLACWITLRSRGNAAFALTIVWALVAVLVANVTREVNPAVAAVAGVMAIVVVGSLLWARSAAHRTAL